MTVFIPALQQEDDYEYEYDVNEEQVPVNCSTNERIRDGHVTYSEVRTQNSSVPAGQTSSNQEERRSLLTFEKDLPICCIWTWLQLFSSSSRSTD